MQNLIDKPQLQATAQVAKSYILDQDTANVNTIINALQQSGGGNTKQKGIITINPGWIDLDHGDPPYTFSYSYNGDAAVIVSASTDGAFTVSAFNAASATVTVRDYSSQYFVYAPETENFTSAFASVQASYD